MTFTIFNCRLIHIFKKMKHWNLDIVGYWGIWADCKIEKDLEPNPSPPNFSKVSWPIDQVWRLNELWFKRYSQKCTLSHVLILIVTLQILQILGLLKIKIFDYLENGIQLFYEIKKFLNYAWHILKSYCFVGEVTFNTLMSGGNRKVTPT